MKRSNVFLTFIFLLAAIFAFQLINLQFFSAREYRKLADENAARVTPIIAPRGIIYDRNGKVLLKNKPVFSIYVLPHFIPKDRQDEIFDRLANIINKPREFIDNAYRNNRSPLYEGVLIMRDVPNSIVSRLEEEQRRLPGVEMVCYPMRNYPYGDSLAHVLGYIGEVEPDELESLKESGYRMGDLLGKDGVEKSYDQYLRGMAGGKKIEVDAYGRSTRIIETLEPVPGNDVKLTLDLDLQLVVEKALGRSEGAVVVLNPKTGEILALASHPAYHPGIVEKFVGRYDHPFMNRALSPYPPGSIFKVVTLTAALESGMTKLKETFYCPGFYKLGTRIAACWRVVGHGRISPIEGLVWSCDIVFYELGKRLGPDIINSFGKKYGLGERTGIDLPQEKRGFLPSSAWKKERFKEDWYDGDSINIGIGQGFIQVTPLQMAQVYAAVATGSRMAPFVVKEVVGKDGKVIYSAEEKKLGDVPLSPANLALIRGALTDVVWRGTGVGAYVPGLPAAGKTGTAENPGLPHAWFICYAPTDDPELVISSFVVHGQHGDQVTARIAREILTWYKENRLIREIEEKPRQGQYILHGQYRESYRPVQVLETPQRLDE